MVRRVVIAVLIAGTLMVADGLAMIGVARHFAPHPAPNWATAPFFWALAWSVQLFSMAFPRAPGDTTGGPTFIAVALGALLDLALLSIAVDWIRRRRASRR